VSAAGAAAEMAVRRELLNLCGEVLFLPDPEKPAHFHPRINLHKTDSFRSLDGEIRERVWQVYVDFFYRRHEYYWTNHGRERLAAVCDAAGMLICGEDLGMVPDCVPAVMAQLGILGLRVQRMPTRPGIDLNHPAEYPYDSVGTTATHDMAPLREWWDNLSDPHLRRDLCAQLKGWEGPPPGEATPEFCAAVIRQHLEATSMWAVFPLQDLLAMDAGLRHPDPYAERINIPSDPDHYWRYRLHLTLELLLSADEFNHRLAGMIARAGRGCRVFRPR
jgi:4-alpha-glucanotransferase